MKTLTGTYTRKNNQKHHSSLSKKVFLTSLKTLTGIKTIYGNSSASQSYLKNSRMFYISSHQLLHPGRHFNAQ